MDSIRHPQRSRTLSSIQAPTFYSLPNNSILASTKLKADADDLCNGAKMTIFVFSMVENVMEKGENAGSKHFLHLSKCF